MTVVKVDGQSRWCKLDIRVIAEISDKCSLMFGLDSRLAAFARERED
jgi:hypothetical protein